MAFRGKTKPLFWGIIISTMLILSGCTLDDLGRGAPLIYCVGSLKNHKFDYKKHQYELYLVAGVLDYGGDIQCYARGVYDRDTHEGSENIKCKYNKNPSVPFMNLPDAFTGWVKFSCPVDPWLYPDIPLSPGPVWTSDNIPNMVDLLNLAMMKHDYTLETLFPLSRWYFDLGLSDSQLEALREEANKKEITSAVAETVTNACSDTDKLKPPKIVFPDNRFIFRTDQKYFSSKVWVILEMPCYLNFPNRSFSLEVEGKNFFGSWHKLAEHPGHYEPKTRMVGGVPRRYMQGMVFFDPPLEGRHGYYRFRVHNRNSSEFTDWRYYWWGQPEIDTSKLPAFIKNSPDLTIDSFKGKVLDPGQEDYSGLATDYRRIQLHWTVKNKGEKASPATVLRVRGVADGTVPLPDDWMPDVNMKRKDFPVPILDPAIHQATHDVYEVFAAPDGSIKFRFNAQVNSNRLFTESNYANNGRLSTFGLKLTGIPPAYLSPKIHVHRPSQPGPWYPGENHSVRWQSTGIEGKVRIFLGRGQGEAVMDEAYRYEWSPPGGVANTGYWRHNLPKNMKPDEQYRICIQSVENSKIMGCSEAFPIRMRLHAGAVKTRMKRHLDRHPAGSTIQLGHKPALKPGKKPPAVMQKLWLQSPHGMETWYIGKTYPVTWQATGVTGRVRVVLVDRHGKKRTINGMAGTDAHKGRFSWKIGSNIQPGAMYRIYVTTVDGKVRSKSCGGFNIRMKVDASTAGKALEKKKKPQIKSPPKGGHINLQ